MDDIFDSCIAETVSPQGVHIVCFNLSGCQGQFFD